MFRLYTQLKTVPIMRLINGVLIALLCFGLNMPAQYAYAQSLPGNNDSISHLDLSIPGEMVRTSSEFVPTLIKGLKIYPDNPLRFDFILESGDAQVVNDLLYEESNQLIKYFLASLTIPEDDMWVNLSPFEQQRIIPEKFGITEMGRDLLAQDYILKQLTASMMFPDDTLGQTFWTKVRKKIFDKYGTSDVQLDTYVKVWILPKDAVIYENGDTAYVLDTKLQVMLEQDYIAHTEHDKNKKIDITEIVTDEQTKNHRDITAEIIREIIIPAIEKEVNEGQHFAKLRQIYHSMILATWFKQNLKDSLLGRIYLDQGKTEGVDVDDKEIKQKIYEQYIEAFETGVYNYIKEEYDPVSQELIPRKYFSGGVQLKLFGAIDADTLKIIRRLDRPLQPKGTTFYIDHAVDPVSSGSRAGLVDELSAPTVEGDQVGTSIRFSVSEFQRFQSQNYDRLNTSFNQLIEGLTSDIQGERRDIEATITEFLTDIKEQFTALQNDKRKENEFIRQYQSLLQVRVNGQPARLLDLEGQAVSPAITAQTTLNGASTTQTTISVDSADRDSQSITIAQYDQAPPVAFFNQGTEAAQADLAILASNGATVDINVDRYFGVDKTRTLLEELATVIKSGKQAVMRINDRDYVLETVLQADFTIPVFRARQILQDGALAPAVSIKFFSEVVFENLGLDQIGIISFFQSAQNDPRIQEFFARQNYENMVENFIYLPHMMEMEYIRGESMEQITNPAQRLEFIAQLADELAYTSSTYKAFHGDITVNNVYRDDTTKKPRLIDYDTLKVDSTDRSIRDVRAGIKYKDILAVGSLLLNVFANTSYEPDDSFRSQQGVSLEDFDVVATRGKTTFTSSPQNLMPASIWAIVEKAMFANPNDHYESMEDLNNDLQQALASIDINELFPQLQIEAEDTLTIKGKELKLAKLTKEMLLSNDRYRQLNQRITRYKSSNLADRENMDEYSYVILDADNQPQGYAILQDSGRGSSVQMSDLVVAKELEGTPAASWLLNHTFRNAQSQSQGRLTSARWLFNYRNSGLSERGLTFYDSIGATGRFYNSPDEYVQQVDAYTFDFEQNMPTLQAKFERDLQKVSTAETASVPQVDEAKLTIDAEQTIETIDIAISPPDLSTGQLIETSREEERATPLGGIDLNPKNLNIESRGSGINITVPLDPQIMRDLEQMPIDGFQPIIFQIVPVTNLPMLLGVAEDTPNPNDAEISFIEETPAVKEEQGPLLELSANSPEFN